MFMNNKLQSMYNTTPIIISVVKIVSIVAVDIETKAPVITPKINNMIMVVARLYIATVMIQDNISMVFFIFILSFYFF